VIGIAGVKNFSFFRFSQFDDGCSSYLVPAVIPDCSESLEDRALSLSLSLSLSLLFLGQNA